MRGPVNAATLAEGGSGIAFAGSGLLHAAVDFLVHHDDARRQVWPLSDWVFRSPVSYRDPRYFGQVAGPVEIAVCLGLSVRLWRRFAGESHDCGGAWPWNWPLP